MIEFNKAVGEDFDNMWLTYFSIPKLLKRLFELLLAYNKHFNKISHIMSYDKDNHAPGGRGRFSGSRPFGRGFQGRFQGPPKSGGGVVPECQICNKRGHTAVNCYFRNSNTSSPGSSSTIECQICGKKGHGALDCYHHSNYVYQGSPPPASLTALAAQASFSRDAVWIADSGASHHMVPHMTTMDSASPCTSFDQVRVGNREGLRIDHIGSAHIPTTTSSLSLSSVFHIPQLTANLLSVYHLCQDNNCRMIFDQFGFSIQDKVTNRVLFHGKSDHGLYLIPCFIPSSTHVDNKQLKMAFLGQQIHSSLWHRRLGHPTNEVVQLMLREAQLPVVSDSISQMCSYCLNGKMHHLPFSARHDKLMGYKGVLCYNCSTQRIVISRHVIHDESVYPFKHPSTFHSNILSYVSPSLSINLPSTLVLSSETLVSHANHPSSSPSRREFSPAAPSPLVPPDASSSSVQPLADSFPVSSGEHMPPIDHVISSSSSSLSSSQNIHPITTRSKSGLCQQKSFEDYQCFTSMHDSTTLDEPSTFRVASFSPAWIKAMEEEIYALTMQGTWCLVPRPANTNIVGSKWIYKIKRNSDGTVSRYKARLVAHGFSQEAGFDYHETFSPVVRHTTVRLILSLASINGWSLRQLDVKNAFLHGDLDEEVYMKQPQGFEDSSHPEYVCKLQKSLYGLKQAPRAWNAKFTGYLPSLGFKMSHSDPSLFVKISDSAIVVLLLYVDDIILTGSNSHVIQEVITNLGSVFDLKDLGPFTFFLGLQISYKSNGDLFISQQKYAKDLLVKAGMESCRSCPTPSKPHRQVLPTDGEPLKEPLIYRSIVGALQYLTFTRPDLAYSVNTVCQFMNNPTEVHFYDADWAGDITTRQSTTSFVVFLGSNPISWQSKKQGSVSRSSTEAEYRALANASAEVAWIRQILADLHVFLSESPLLFCDNMSALALSSIPVFHSRIKHLDVDFHFVLERVQRKDFLVQYIPTDDQVADILTKGLHSPVFIKNCTNLSLGTLTEIEGGGGGVYPMVRVG
ncbi:hypothetical protein L3X38_030570 [Prunus dulcis]|uniref:CCHC-type domain-containing protein n=1 Tax=Prunus dulcis TaxID=3755 RepID=A0AAD4VBP6_PRUDU|nr:hypothetical protein L3X38_030570 [Prunus dulcis]